MADVGSGATITFGTSAWTGSLISINGQDIARAVVETTALATTVAKTFMPGDLYDAGGWDIEFYLNPNEPPPITAAAETITVTFPIPAGGATGATAAASGFVSKWSPSVGGVDEVLKGKMTVKLSGQITWTDAT